MKIFTTAQVRELDRLAIQNHGIPGYQLMQRAGQAAFSLLQQRWPQIRTIDIYCGTGNNGGDGSVIGLLALKAGLDCRLIQLGDDAKIHGDAARAREDYLLAGGKVVAFTNADFRAEQRQPDMIIDAIFGTGLDRPASGEYANAIEQINTQAPPILAIDIPSGLDSDTGMPLGTTVCAHATITFIAMKQGLLTGSARDFTGELVLDSLQLQESIFQAVATHKYLLSTSDLSKMLPCRKHASHKGHFGHVLLIGGAPGFSGAIRLSAEAALRSGAGLVTVATHPTQVETVNVLRPEIMTVSTSDDARLDLVFEQCTVIGIGPGLGTTDDAMRLLKRALQCDKPTVVDADALNLLATHPDLRNISDGKWILTPHPGEAARLLGVSKATIQADRFKSAAEIQHQYGGVVVLKGSGSLIQSAATTAVCSAGNPGMASGGMGDTLTGIICALLAQKLPLQQAAETGVLLHALAADQAAKAGERGMIASDLFPHIRQLCNP